MYVHIYFIHHKEGKCGGNWNISVKIGRTCIKYTYFIEGGGQANIKGGKSKIEVIWASSKDQIHRYWKIYRL